jgi:stage V sporulation protein S
MDKEETILRVKGSSSAISLASVVAYGVYDGKNVVLRAIGAAAVNQAMKAVAIAQSYVGAKGMRLMVIPGFTDVAMEDRTVTALVFKIRVE